MASGDLFTDIMFSLEASLEIGKYLTKHNGNYKKDKKTVKKMYKDLLKGNFQKYLKESEVDDE